MSWVDGVKIALEVTAGVVAVIGWAHRTIVKPAKEWRDNLDTRLSDISKELKTNGGASLRDEIIAIRKQTVASAARFLAFGHESAFGCFISSPDGACVWTNRAYLRLTERTEEEVLGWGWSNIVHPDDRERVRREWELAIEEGREFHSTHRYITPSGEDVNVYVHARPVTDDAGAIIEHIGFVRGYDDSCTMRNICKNRRRNDA